jgi:hypothetical protein
VSEAALAQGRPQATMCAMGCMAAQVQRHYQEEFKVQGGYIIIKEVTISSSLA